MRDVRQAVDLTAFSDICTTAIQKLIPGLYIYSPVTIAGTTVKTLGTTDVTLSRNAFDDYTGSVYFSDLTPMAYQMKCDALKQIKLDVDLVGSLVQFNYRDETDVVRDDYGSIKKFKTDHPYYMKCYPIVKSPSPDRLEKAGLKGEVDVMFYLPSLSWYLNGFDFDDMRAIEKADKIRMTVKVDNQTYEIKQIAETGQISNDWQYLVFSAVKK
jgi:hypothetical protein